MAQQSVRFAAAKIKLKQAKAISQNDITRLMDAPTFQNAKQVLVDIGFLPNVQEDYETYADKYITDACINIRKYSPLKALSNVLLYTFDAHNLKVMFKARLLQTEPNYLYTCGTVNPEKIKHAVANHNYSVLPTPFKKCMNELEKLVVTGIAPYQIDAHIDNACSTLVNEELNELNIPKLQDYVHKKSIFSNIMIALRLQQMGKNQEFASDLLIQSQGITKAFILKHYNAMHYLLAPLKQVDKPFARAFERFLNAQLSLAELEKIADNSLLSIFKDVYYKNLDICQCILYFVASQRQAATLRLVMAAKQSGVPKSAIEERMRHIHAK